MNKQFSIQISIKKVSYILSEESNAKILLAEACGDFSHHK